MLSGSIVAIVTPFTDSGEVDYEAYQALLDWHCASGTSGVVVAGTTGESAALSLEEIKKLVALTVDRCQGKMRVLVGNGSIATQKVIETTMALNSLQFDGYLTVTPYYVKPSQKGLVEHFKAVADAAEHPVYLYNVPGRTCCDLSNESVVTLSKHPNIVGIKDATADLTRVEELIAQVSGQFAVLSGDDATSQAFMELGGDGVISVTANLVPEAMAQRCHYLAQGEIERAREIDGQIKDLHQLLFVEANPVPVKWALSQQNKIKNTLRLPLTPLEKGKDALMNAMRRLSLVG